VRLALLSFLLSAREILLEGRGTPKQGLLNHYINVIAKDDYSFPLKNSQCLGPAFSGLT